MTDFDFESFKQEYEKTGTIDTQSLIENLQENGCLDEFKQNVVKDTINTILDKCVYYNLLAPIINKNNLYKVFGEQLIMDIYGEEYPAYISYERVKSDMNHMQAYVIDLEALAQFGFTELNNCYFKELVQDWILRVDKKTKQLTCWNWVNGKIKEPTPFIKDLVMAGVVK